MKRGTPLCISLTILLLGTPSVFAQTPQGTLKVEFVDGSRPPSTIKAVARGERKYVSVNDLVTQLGLPIVEASSKSFTFSVDRGTVRLNKGNPFLVVTDSLGLPAGYQLTGDVIVQRAQFYAPLAELLSMLSSRVAVKMAIDSTGNVLRIGTEEPTVPGTMISSVAMETKSNGMLLRVPLSPALTDVEHWVTSEGWLYLTIAGAKGNIAALNATKPEGFVKKVEATQFEGSLQLAFRLSEKSVEDEVSRDPGTGDLVVILRKDETQEAPNVDLSREHDRWAFDVIVIDPGHGGKDGGAVGVTGVKEKDVTLGIALKLGAIIKRQMKNVKVVYTRTTDKFVELDKRGTIANEAGGKLFISIHCNSMPRKPNPTRGFEVYLLRPGRTDEAVAIAERENAVIKLEEDYQQKYQHLTDENFILTTMAQSAHVKSSEEFANLLQREMEAHAGIPNRGVKQAGFYVLVGASMPNVLIETAYLSNRQDELFLKSDKGQEKIAESIAAAVKRYSNEYDRLLQEGTVEE